MPITLRNPSNPNTDVIILNTIANVIHKNAAGSYCTYLAQISTSQTGAELTYIQNRYKMALGMTPALPYALHLSSGKQRYAKNSTFEWLGQLEVLAEYVARWDEQASSIDTIRSTIAADLERLKANLETNDALVYQGADFTISVPTMQLSDYKGTLDGTFPGLTLVERTLSFQVNILPYLTIT